MKSKIYILITFLMTIDIVAQIVEQSPNWGWPVRTENNVNQVGSMIGTPGEYRTPYTGAGSIFGTPYPANQDRFHQGVDLVGDDGTAGNIYSIEEGMHEIDLESSGYNRRMLINQTIYWHLNEAQGLQIGTVVNANQLVATMNSTAAHLHIQTPGDNYLIDRLPRYQDCAAPQIISYSLRQEGHNLDNASEELDETISINNVDYTLIYDKTDIVVRSRDFRTNPDCNGNNGNLAPNQLFYQLLEDIPLPALEPIGDEILNVDFSTLPVQEAAEIVFGIGTDCCNPVRFDYVITNHPREQPYNRYWHTRLRQNTTDTWNYDANNANGNFVDADYEDLEAKINQEATLKDGAYKLKIGIRDVDEDGPENGNETSEIEHIIVDNFRPYIKQIEVTEQPQNPPIPITLYKANWNWDDENNTLSLAPQNTPVGNKKQTTDGMEDIKIELETSEPMKEMFIQLNDGVVGTYPSSPIAMTSTDNTTWSVTIQSSIIPSTAFGDQTIHITGKDRTNNDVLGFNTQYTYTANQLPHRVGSGSTYTTANWSVAFPATTDQIHIFEISDCIYNEGGNKKSSNNCLADFTAHAFYPNQGSNFCNNNNPIPYIHPVEGGYFVRPSTTGRIFLDASNSTGVSDPLDPLNYEWFFYPDAPANISNIPNITGSTQATGKTLSVDWTTPGDKVIELRIQCDGACSTKRINVAVAESPCTETKTPVFEPDQLAATDIVASFFHPAACEYVGQASCPNSANFNNGQIITNPHYYGASGCYELDVYEIVNGTQIAVVQNLYETGAYTLDCLEEGIYRVVMKDNVSACEIEQFVYLRDKNPVIAFDIAPVCDGNGDKAVVSAYIEEPLGCMTVVQVEGGGQGIGGSVIVTENQPINVYLGLGANQILYLQNQTIDIPEISQLSLNFTVTSTSGSNQCDGSIAPTASNGSGNYTYTVDDGNDNDLIGICVGSHILKVEDEGTSCIITVPFTVHAQINKPNNPDIIEVFTIHPNPFDDLVNISTTCDQLAPGDNSQIPVTISIYNSSGGHALTVYSGNLAPQQNHTFPVDVSNFSSGTYIFTIEALGQGESLMGIKN